MAQARYEHVINIPYCYCLEDRPANMQLYQNLFGIETIPGNSVPYRIWQYEYYSLKPKKLEGYLRIYPAFVVKLLLFADHYEIWQYEYYSFKQKSLEGYLRIDLAFVFKLLLFAEVVWSQGAFP